MVIKLHKYKGFWYFTTDQQWILDWFGWPRLTEPTRITGTVGTWWNWFWDAREHKKFLDRRNKK
jgi:hypothetical protein